MLVHSRLLPALAAIALFNSASIESANPDVQIGIHGLAGNAGLPGDPAESGESGTDGGTAAASASAFSSAS